MTWRVLFLKSGVTDKSMKRSWLNPFCRYWIRVSNQSKLLSFHESPSMTGQPPICLRSLLKGSFPTFSMPSVCLHLFTRQRMKDKTGRHANGRETHIPVSQSDSEILVKETRIQKDTYADSCMTCTCFSSSLQKVVQNFPKASLRVLFVWDTGRKQEGADDMKVAFLEGACLWQRKRERPIKNLVEDP